VAKNGKGVVVAVRGLKDVEKNNIWLDGETRRRLGVEVNQPSKAGWRGRLEWALHSSDPAVRISTWIAIAGVVHPSGSRRTAKCGTTHAACSARSSHAGASLY
jgi:hypothetical protein